jgi:amino-acid N-acetyltransferase
VPRLSVSADFRVRPTTRADHREIRALLAAAQLPVDDLDRAATLRLWVAEAGSSIVGAIGLERSGTTALLRSLVVAPPFRERRIAVALVAALESDARQAGIEALVLLTETAESFFLRLGYGVVDRSAVSEGIRALEEFRSLCPATAVCLAKKLDARPRDAFHG